MGHFFCLLHIPAFMDLDEFTQRMDQTIDGIKSCTKRPGVDEILVPGELIVAKCEKANRERGITLSKEILAGTRTMVYPTQCSFPLSRGGYLSDARHPDF